jgi:hypothetical protein
MLRTLIFAPMAFVALGAPGVAAAEQFPAAALHADIVSDTGEVVGRVEGVERDREGRIVAIESEALEPADAPVSRDLVAERQQERRVVISENTRREGGNGASRAR